MIVFLGNGGTLSKKHTTISELATYVALLIVDIALITPVLWTIIWFGLWFTPFVQAFDFSTWVPGYLIFLGVLTVVTVVSSLLGADESYDEYYKRTHTEIKF